MDGKIAQYELVQHALMAPFGVRILLLHLLRRQFMLLQSRREQPLPVGGRANLRSGDESLETGASQSCIPEPAPLALGAGQPVAEMAERAESAQHRRPAFGAKHVRVALVTGEQLVASLTRKHDFDMLRSKLGN